jgi:1-deoxy-D-xylulose 5-phosphate reductoisomerase
MAVHAFLEGRIGFASIPAVVEQTLDLVEQRDVETAADVAAADREARTVALERMGSSC